MTPDVGSGELCATMAHVNVVAKPCVFWQKGKTTRECGNMTGKKNLGKFPVEESCRF